jgi:hypothetical protein
MRLKRKQLILTESGAQGAGARRRWNFSAEAKSLRLSAIAA